VIIWNASNNIIVLHVEGGTVLHLFLLLCECGDGLQTEEHIFWDCKLYEGQRAAMMDFLSKNGKKEYTKSVTELLQLEEKRFVQGACYFINNIPIFV
jgi:hypothetical protein